MQKIAAEWQATKADQVALSRLRRLMDEENEQEEIRKIEVQQKMEQFRKELIEKTKGLEEGVDELIETLVKDEELSIQPPSKRQKIHLGIGVIDKELIDKHMKDPSKKEGEVEVKKEEPENKREWKIEGGKVK